MCMVVFAATDETLPLASTEEAFLFQAQPLLAEIEPVRRLFSKPYVYDLTSVGGCGCSFSYGPYDLENQSDEAVPAAVRESERSSHEQSRQSVRLLQEWLRTAAGMGTVEVYSCWSGDEGAEPETRLAVGLDHFGGEEFSPVERQFITVHGD